MQALAHAFLFLPQSSSRTVLFYAGDFDLSQTEPQIGRGKSVRANVLMYGNILELSSLQGDNGHLPGLSVRVFMTLLSQNQLES